MAQGAGGGPKAGFKQSKQHKAKIAKAQEGKSNSNYKDGGRLDYRKIAGAKKGDGKIIHHISGKRDKGEHHQKSNLKVLTDGKKPGAKTSSSHERIERRAAKDK